MTNEVFNNLRDNLSLNVRKHTHPGFPGYVKQILTKVSSSDSSADLELVLHDVVAFEANLRQQVSDLRIVVRDLEHLRALAIHREFNPEPASV